jgi:hypothetical protein
MEGPRGFKGERGSWFPRLKPPSAPRHASLTPLPQATMENQGCPAPRATKASEASKALPAPEALKVCFLKHSSVPLSAFMTMLSGVPGAQGAKGDVGPRGFDGARGPEGPSVRALTLNSIPVLNSCVA